MDRGMSTIMTAAAFAFYKAINGEKLRKPIGWLKTEMELNKYEHTDSSANAAMARWLRLWNGDYHAPH